MKALASPAAISLACLAAAILAVFLLAPNKFALDIAILAGINAIACVGLNLLIGYAGQISLGHAAFFAIGAYMPTILQKFFAVNLLLGVGASVATTGLIAYLIGRPILRLKGHHLAMATLGLGAVIAIAVNTETKVTGGADGLIIPRPLIGGTLIDGEHVWFWIVAVALILVVWACLNVVDSPIGRRMRAVHGSEFAARAAGIDTHGVKVGVFVASAILACVAGVLFGQYAGFVTPEKASFVKSVELVTMVVVGGLASIYGAVIGAVLLTMLPQVLTFFDNYQLAAFGLILILTLVVLPQGIVPGMQELAGNLLRRARKQ